LKSKIIHEVNEKVCPTVENYYSYFEIKSKVFLTLFVKALRQGELSRIANCSQFNSMQVTTENVFSPSLSRAYHSS